MSEARISEPARETRVLDRTDVLVVGGGSAGVSAAVAAARSGARVTLVERYGSLGGLATGGCIALLLTLDDGRGRPVIGGLCQELTERMGAKGGAFHPPPEEWGDDDPALVGRYRTWGLVWGGRHAHHRVRYSVAYDPEIMRQCLNEMVIESGVELLLHMWGADAIVEDGRVQGVVFQSKAGREAILADVVIDATGDGDVFASAGCEFELETVHPWLWFRMGGLSAEQAVQAGGFRTPAESVALFPWGSAAGIERKIDATDPRDLTFAELHCRAKVMEEYERVRREVPGAGAAHLCNVATQLGITESRRLRGAFVLERAHMGQGFADTICVTGHWTKYEAVYAIPYRCLQAPGIENLLVAGRIISVDHRVHHATKEIPACMAVGEAAGVAAALALDAAGAAPGDVQRVPSALLRERLVAGGALLDYFD